MEAVKDRKPHIRAGQAAFNALLKLRPEIAERIRGGPLDPFHHDERIGAFLAEVGQAEQPAQGRVGELRRIDQTLVRAMAALESDAGLDARRAAFDAIQDLYEPGRALASLPPAGQPVAAPAQDRRCSPEAPRLPPPAARGRR
jgi:hypothetical protein